MASTQTAAEAERAAARPEEEVAAGAAPRVVEAEVVEAVERWPLGPRC